MTQDRPGDGKGGDADALLGLAVTYRDESLVVVTFHVGPDPQDARPPVSLPLRSSVVRRGRPAG